MRLPEGVTLNDLRNVYNSRKRQEKLYANARRNRRPYNTNAVVREQNIRRRIQQASGLPLQQFAALYRRYANIRNANNNARLRRVAGKFRAGGRVSVMRPILERQLGTIIGRNFGNNLRRSVYRNASPIRRR